MISQSALSAFNNKIGKQDSRIHSLSGLKVIAIWLIFWWHSWLNNPPCDLGARCCEFFFAASGFLVYYSHKDTSSCTWKDSFNAVLRKLAVMWPMHFLAFMICLLLLGREQIFSLSTLVCGILNLSLLQSWFNYEQVFFSFNGPSWFLSSLLFCYFMAPVLLRLIKKKKKAFIYFILAFAIRYTIEELEFYHPDTYMNFNIHVSPIIRLFEFFFGMLTACIWSMAMEFISKKLDSLNPHIIFAAASVCEAAVLFLTYYFMLTKQNTWGRHIFSLWFCVLIFFFAFDAGIISRLLSLKPLRWFAGIQFEFYIFHIPVLKLVSRYIEPHITTAAVLAGISFAIIILLSCLYKYVLKRPSESIMKKILNKCSKYICE